MGLVRGKASEPSDKVRLDALSEEHDRWRYRAHKRGRHEHCEQELAKLYAEMAATSAVLHSDIDDRSETDAPRLEVDD
jgi:hypothetical protein